MINIVIILFIVYKIKERRNMQNKTNIKCCLLATVSSTLRNRAIYCVSSILIYNTMGAFGETLLALFSATGCILSLSFIRRKTRIDVIQE